MGLIKDSIVNLVALGVLVISGCNVQEVLK